jgi:hypothetical protein
MARVYGVAKGARNIGSIAFWDEGRPEPGGDSPSLPGPHSPRQRVQNMGCRGHLRSIAPTSLEGINLRGTFDFPIADYVHRLMPSLVRAPVPSQRAG